MLRESGNPVRSLTSKLLFSPAYRNENFNICYIVGRVTDLCHHATSSKLKLVVVNIIYFTIPTLRCISMNHSIRNICLFVWFRLYSLHSGKPLYIASKETCVAILTLHLLRPGAPHAFSLKCTVTFFVSYI